MNKLPIALLLVTSVASASLLSTTPVRADDTVTTDQEQEGRAHFLRGLDFSHDGDSRAALIEFRRAYEIAPNYRVLFNIGQTALELSEYAQSLDAFEKYLADGGDEIPAARRTRVEAEVKRLLTRVANVTVTVNVPGASVLVDDVMVGTSPLDHPLRIGAGRHKFSASTTATVPVSRVLDLSGGEAKTLNLELVAPGHVPAAPERVGLAESGDRPPSRNTTLWIGVGVTGALAIGTVVMGAVALSNKSSFDEELRRYSVDGNGGAIDSARSSLKTSALVFDLLAAATVVSGGVTLVLGLSAPHRPSPSATSRARTGLLDGTF